MKRTMSKLLVSAILNRMLDIDKMTYQQRVKLYRNIAPPDAEPFYTLSNVAAAVVICRMEFIWDDTDEHMTDAKKKSEILLDT